MFAKVTKTFMVENVYDLVIVWDYLFESKCITARISLDALVLVWDYRFLMQMKSRQRKPCTMALIKSLECAVRHWVFLLKLVF